MSHPKTIASFVYGLPFIHILSLHLHLLPQLFTVGLQYPLLLLLSKAHQLQHVSPWHTQTATPHQSLPLPTLHQLTKVSRILELPQILQSSFIVLLVKSVTPSTAENTQWDLLSILAMKGCSEGCATSVHSLQPGEILFFHGNFSARTIHQQNQWLLEYLNSNGSHEDMRFSFVVCGKLVCLPLWLSILGVSQRRFYRLRGEFMAGKVTLEKLPSLQKLSKTSNAAIGWMENYFTRYDSQSRNSTAIVCDVGVAMHICVLLLPNDFCQFVSPVVLVTTCLTNRPCISLVC